MEKKNKLFIVIPCYNEESVLNETTRQLDLKLKNLIKSKKISRDSKVLYVNDGSKDSTWALIEQIHKQNPLFTGLSLSRNRGHQNALLAGLMYAKDHADIVISMDADLQDDINTIDGMIDKYYDGCEIVYGVRSSRKKDTFFKKNTAQIFYKFMKFLGVDIIYNHADYRLASSKILRELNNFNEVNLFLRAMFPLIGYKSDIIYYERNERYAGESKYNLKKMLNFAWEGITSFSIKPIRLVLSLGIIMFIVSFIMIIYCLIVKMLGNTVEGWTFIICSIWLIAGIQMLSLGVIGEYIGKIYQETKRRPRYIISRNLELENEKDI